MIKYLLINPITGENIIRDLNPNQIKEVVRDGFTMLVPLKSREELLKMGYIK